jgi:adenylate cyclase
MPSDPSIDEMWRQRLTSGENAERRLHRLLGLLPSSPRCKACNAPFRGAGGLAMRLIGKRQSKENPRFCDPCTGMTEHPGGAEVELTMFFADVRGSTTLAEKMSASEFSRLMHRFYATASGILIQTDALLDRFVGDQVIGIYLPGFAGQEHARRAVEAAQSLLKATGHGSPHGPWLPIGIGIHTGIAFVGVVAGPDGKDADITALGDTVNTAARLAAQAGPGEVILSNATYNAAKLKLADLEQRQLELKGKSDRVDVYVMQAGALHPA